MKINGSAASAPRAARKEGWSHASPKKGIMRGRATPEAAVRGDRAPGGGGGNRRTIAEREILDGEMDPTDVVEGVVSVEYDGPVGEVVPSLKEPKEQADEEGCKNAQRLVIPSPIHIPRLKPLQRDEAGPLKKYIGIDAVTRKVRSE
ncbi:hypothetical protein [Candidatus Methanocrinis natronophilus]|uniref:Uncharacterized protein n=1 Tax=Candidatus Methanocrinis natronophilus TaxID=3033396 RepID=A0ABT5X8B9_9EURY|nr:hypothetical protein [Candidatus Methanocrinis natronophilus]MDF0590928.1 hypothetical protein [Candidatus Methanocrinis natronophilus]